MSLEAMDERYRSSFRVRWARWQCRWICGETEVGVVSWVVVVICASVRDLT